MLPRPPNNTKPVISSQKGPDCKIWPRANPEFTYFKYTEFESEKRINGKGIGNPIDAEPKKHITREISRAQK